MPTPNHFRIPDEGYTDYDEDLDEITCPCGAIFEEDCICEEAIDDHYSEWSGSMRTTMLYDEWD